MEIFLVMALMRAVALADPEKTGIVGFVQVGPEKCMVDYQNSIDNHITTLSAKCPYPVIDPANEWMLD